MPEFGKNAIVLGSTLVFGSRSANNVSNNIVTVNLKNFEISEANQLVLDDNQIFKLYMIFVFIFLVLFTVSLFAYFKNHNVVFYFSENAIRNEKRTLILTPNESKILQKFIDSKELENTFLLELFADKTKSKDSTVKKKNKIIKNFNLKFLNYFGKNLILKKVNKNDSRQVIYSIAPKTSLMSEEAS